MFIQNFIQVVRKEVIHIEKRPITSTALAQPQAKNVPAATTALESTWERPQLQVIAAQREVMLSRKRNFFLDYLRKRNILETICRMTQDPGTTCGTNTLTRYSFNTNTRVCESFTYRGCGGNRNNFASMTQCSNFCNSAGI